MPEQIMEKPRHELLVEEMIARHDWAFRKGHGVERLIGFCWWSTVIFAGLASVAGFVATIPAVAVYVKPWLVSLFALVASGFEVIRQRAVWRPKSNEYYRHRDAMRRLIQRAKYQTPTWGQEPLSTLSQKFADEMDCFGRNMQQINSQRDNAADSKIPG